jgi:photosynthetic reaction center cytochrome c subunit
MKLDPRQNILAAMTLVAICLVGMALYAAGSTRARYPAGGQAPTAAGAPASGSSAQNATAPKPPEVKTMMADDAFKNIQVLKGYSVSQFMQAMGFFCASLGQSCEYCHDLAHGTWDDYAADNDRKNMARKMVLMMNAINKANFNGRREVTCYSCHNGGSRPKITPTIAGVYATPLPEDPNDVALGQAPQGVTPDQILDKYIQALGGAQRLGALTSYAAKGISVGYGDEAYDRAADIFAKAPAERTTIIHTLSGDNTTAYDGSVGWAAAPTTAVPVTVLALAGSDLDGAKVDAALSFPARLKGALTGWRAGAPATIDDKEMQVLQAISPGGHAIRFFFDKDSGLLVRQLRFTDSPVGLNPLQIDYADYRDVAGVKMPFHWMVMWLDGTSTFTLSDVQPNVPIDPAKFAKPPVPVAPPKPPAQ